MKKAKPKQQPIPPPPAADSPASHIPDDNEANMAQDSKPYLERFPEHELPRQPSKAAEPVVEYQSMPGIEPLPIRAGMQAYMAHQSLNNEADYIKLIRQGVPMATFNNIMAKTRLSLTEMATIIHTSDRTLRRYEGSDYLSPEHSEKILEIAALYSMGEETFGNMDTFNKWLNTTHRALGSVKPKDLLDTSIGIRWVMDMLGRIQHGVFS